MKTSYHTELRETECHDCGEKALCTVHIADTAEAETGYVDEHAICSDCEKKKQVRYEIWLNEKRDEKGRLIAMMDGYQYGDVLVFADSGRVEYRQIEDAINPDVSFGRSLEELFRRYNVDHPHRYYNRSLSIGDVVVLYGVEPEPISFAVVSVGFKRLEKVWLPNEIPTEGRLVSDVLRDLNVRMEHEGVEFGEHNFSDMSWIRQERSKNGDRISEPWPMRSRWIAVYPVTGSNEGWYVHIDAIYQPSSLFGEDMEKAKARDPHTFGLSESQHDKRITLGLAKTWSRESAWQIAKRAGELLGV